MKHHFEFVWISCNVSLIEPSMQHHLGVVLQQGPSVWNLFQPQIWSFVRCQYALVVLNRDPVDNLWTEGSHLQQWVAGVSLWGHLLPERSFLRIMLSCGPKLLSSWNLVLCHIAISAGLARISNTPLFQVHTSMLVGTCVVCLRI